MLVLVVNDRAQNLVSLALKPKWKFPKQLGVKTTSDSPFLQWKKVANFTLRDPLSSEGLWLCPNALYQSLFVQNKPLHLAR